MNWKRVLEHHGYKLLDEGVDPFDLLARAAKPGQTIEVQMEFSRSIEVQAGVWVKCGVTLNMLAPQTEPSINAAAECAFIKCAQLVNQGIGSVAPDVAPIMLGEQQSAAEPPRRPR